MKRAKRETRNDRRRKAERPVPDGVAQCVVCESRLVPEMFQERPARAIVIVCEHRSQYVACSGCEVEARHMVNRHDLTGRTVRSFQPTRELRGRGLIPGAVLDPVS